MQRGILPGTAISDAHNSGTWLMPMVRAASAGKVDVRSGVVVKMIDPISSKSPIPLARSNSSSISRVAS